MKNASNSIILGLTFLTLCSCSLEERKAQDPRKPNLIPTSSVWRGGIDGGVWINCTQKESLINCEFYNEEGRKNYEQLFEFCISNDLSNSFGYTSGGNVSVDAMVGSVKFIPVSHAIIFQDGEVDVALTQKSNDEFRFSQIDTCSIPLHLAKDLVEEN